MRRMQAKEIDEIVKDILTGSHKPRGMFATFNWGDAWYSRLITRVTGGPSHVLVGFSYDEKEDDYYESLFGKGVVGPKPFSKVEEWLQESPGTRRIERIDLDLPRNSIEVKRIMAQTYVGMAGYGELQLLAMYFFYRFGWRVPRTPGRLVCSEYAQRILFPEFNVTSEAVSFDEVRPVDLYRLLKNDPRRIK